MRLTWQRSLQWLFIFFAFSRLGGVFASTDMLQAQDVRVIVRQILNYHVDHNELDETLVRRALKVYVDQIDPERIYLLAEEVGPFIQPSAEFSRRVFEDYTNDRFTAFEQLHLRIQAAIKRAQKWRLDQQRNPVALVNKARSFPIEADWEDREFAYSLAELERRVLNHQLRFASTQITQLGQEAVSGKEARVFALYERTRHSLENEYLYIAEGRGRLSLDEQRDRRYTLILKALARSLDSHTAFFSQSEAYDMKVRLEKNFKGVGIVLQESIDGVLITRLIEGGPAEKTGKIESQDRIVAVDGVNILEFSFDTVLELIRGEEGSTVTLGIKRGVGREEKSFDVDIVRAAVVIQDDRVDYSYEQFEDGIVGRIVLHSFYEGAYGVSAVRDVRNAIRELNKIGKLKGLILDLRENTGGFLMQAVKVGGLFISNGVVVVAKYAGGEKRVFRDIDGYAYYDGPMVVLISRVSASAAEIVAQALQDYGVAVVVGDDRSYGKGSIQHQTVTDERSPWFFKVTVGRYYTVSGQSTQIEGVESDIIVPGPLGDEEIGEVTLDYPLARDAISPLYDDGLLDLDSTARQWYRRHYLPSIERKDITWRRMIPELRKRSAKRIDDDPGYAVFLEDEGLGFGEEDGDKPDPQVEEAVEIVKDMIRLQQPQSSVESSSL